jgi:hypothetical protein
MLGKGPSFVFQHHNQYKCVSPRSCNFLTSGNILTHNSFGIRANGNKDMLLSLVYHHIKFLSCARIQCQHNTTHTTQHPPIHPSICYASGIYLSPNYYFTFREAKTHTWNDYIGIYMWGNAPTILPNVPSATTSILSLAVKVHPSDRRSKIVDRCKVPCAEVCSPPWCIGGLPDWLPKQDEHETMDSCCWAWALIGDYFISCCI